MHTEHQDRKFWLQPSYIAKNIEPASPRPRDVKEQHIPRLAMHLGNGFIGIRSFAANHSLQLTDQEFLQSTAHNGMIIGNQHPDHAFYSATLESGMRTLTVVPLPRVLLIVSVPPSKRARSRIPKIPSENLPERPSSLMPLPLS